MASENAECIILVLKSSSRFSLSLEKWNLKFVSCKAFTDLHLAAFSFSPLFALSSITNLQHNTFLDLDKLIPSLGLCFSFSFCLEHPSSRPSNAISFLSFKSISGTTSLEVLLSKGAVCEPHPPLIFTSCLNYRSWRSSLLALLASLASGGWPHDVTVVMICKWKLGGCPLGSRHHKYCSCPFLSAWNTDSHSSISQPLNCIKWKNEWI